MTTKVCERCGKQLKDGEEYICEDCYKTGDEHNRRLMIFMANCERGVICPWCGEVIREYRRQEREKLRREDGGKPCGT